MSEDAIAAIVRALGDLTLIVSDADPAAKAEIYTQLELTLKYRPRNGLWRPRCARASTCAKGSCPGSNGERTGGRLAARKRLNSRSESMSPLYTSSLEAVVGI
jgi:hypothetical protein